MVYSKQCLDFWRVSANMLYTTKDNENNKTNNNNKNEMLMKRESL